MRLHNFRRSGHLRLLKIAALLFAIWIIIDVSKARQAFINTTGEVPPPFAGEKIFIASIHWTDEEILKSHWIPAILELTKEIGPNNVFVSIEESGSMDDTKGALRYLDAELIAAGIRRQIMLDPTTRVDVVERPPAASGWIVMPFDKRVRETWTTWTTVPKGKPVPRRIPYLAGLRDTVLAPLYELEAAGEKFDKILFLNDVVFQVSYSEPRLTTTFPCNADRLSPKMSGDCSPPIMATTPQRAP
nr:hypothetical protein CFP56_69857 [Quercus suber]